MTVDSSINKTASNSASEPVSLKKDRKLKLMGRNFFPFSALWFSIVALEISLLAGKFIDQSDIWWHLRNARELLTSHAFLRADSYTYTAAGTPLQNHEWLSEVAYYLAFRAWGLHGPLAVEVVVLWLTFATVYYLALRRGANCSDAGLVTIAGVALGSYSFAPRMHQFGWLCLAGLLLVLERFQRTGKGLWMLPPLFALWANLHGSWAYGLVVIGVFIASGLLQGQWGKVAAERWTPAELKKLLAASTLSVAALFINPYGYRLVWYPFEVYTWYGRGGLLDNVAEWKSVDFHQPWGKLTMFMLLGLLAAAWFSPRPWKLRDILLSLFAVWASLVHLRFLLFAAIILIPILGPRLRLLSPYHANKDKPWLNLVMTVFIAGLMLWMFPSTAQLQESIDGWFPRDALPFMQRKQMSGRLFNLAEFGGYIEWNTPELKTFVDGRADVFVNNGIFDDYMKINAIENPFELLDKYKIEYVLFPVNRRLSYVLDRSERWRTIYGDNVVKLYERAPATVTSLKADRK